MGAFFDIDNTMLRGSSMFYMAIGLTARGFFRWSQVADFAGKQLKYVLSGEDIADMTAIIEQAQTLVRGRAVADVIAIGEEIFEQFMAPRIRPGTLARANEHLDRGDQVWLVSATGQELAEMFAGHLGLTGALGTRSEVRDGVYTGRLSGPAMHGPAKADAIRELAAREGLDLAGSFAYADSANDIPMLGLVGNPVAVNPDRELRAHARREGWNVLEYRRGRRMTRIGGLVVLGVSAAAIGIAITRHASRRVSGQYPGPGVGQPVG